MLDSGNNGIVPRPGSNALSLNFSGFSPKEAFINIYISLTCVTDLIIMNNYKYRRETFNGNKAFSVF
jgi:hypothetical protein